jgi:DNA-binding HxlR family transcriptional regulator
MKQEQSDSAGEISQLKVAFENCPVQASLGTLGRKWAFLVLRNIALFDKHRFNEMLRVTPGLTKRVLSMRLKELESEGFIKVVERGSNYSKWDLTEKGRDALPVLMTLVQFGSKWYASRVFNDKMPRALTEVFSESYIQKIMRNSTVEVPASTYLRGVHRSRR